MADFKVITPEKIRVEALSLDILNQISRISNSTLDLQERLVAIVEIVVKKMDKDACTIFLLDSAPPVLHFKAGAGLNTGSMQSKTFQTNTGLLGKVIRERVPLAYADIKSDPHAQFLIESCFEQFNSILSVPILMGEKFIGIISLHTIDIWEYRSDEIMLLSTIANDIAGIIKTSLLYLEQKRRLEHVEAIQRIGRAINSTLNLKKLLQMIIENSVNITHAKGGVLRLYNKDTNSWITKSYCGHDTEFCNIIIDHPLDGEISEQLFNIKDALLFNTPDNLDRDGQIKSFLCAPLISRDVLVGTISLYDKTEQGVQFFTEDDKRLLSTLADLASSALENARIYNRMEMLAEENRKRLLRITVVYKIGTALKTTLDFDKLIDITLAGITMGGGLGFNRAMLFLLNEKAGVLEGQAGVGPDSNEDAARIWSDLESKGIERKDIARWIGSEGHIASKKDSFFNATTKKITIAVTGQENIFSKAVFGKKAFIISDPHNDEGITGTEFWKQYQADEFAVVPLLTELGAIGVIVVDNSFTGKIITSEDLEFLKMLANQSALAVENASIHAKLEQAMQELQDAQEKIIHFEKMVALGELSASVAHEIRNPLIAINGFANRIRKKLPDDMELKQYGDIIIAESSKLEKVLEEILVYSVSSKNVQKQLQEIDLNKFILEFLRDNKEILNAKIIKVSREFEDNLPPIRINGYQLKQVLTNIFSNAEQAMEKVGGLISVTTTRSVDGITFSISNTGDIIPPDVISNIFNPFFTTKKKGTGLGLAIVHRIISSNNGKITVENIPDTGVKFTVTLPVES